MELADHHGFAKRLLFIVCVCGGGAVVRVEPRISNVTSLDYAHTLAFFFFFCPLATSANLRTINSSISHRDAPFFSSPPKDVDVSANFFFSFFLFSCLVIYALIFFYSTFPPPSSVVSKFGLQCRAFSPSARMESSFHLAPRAALGVFQDHGERLSSQLFFFFIFLKRGASLNIDCTRSFSTGKGGPTSATSLKKTESFTRVKGGPCTATIIGATHHLFCFF